LRLVAVDFEAGGPTWERLVDTGFDNRRRAVIASTGVSMYLSKDAVRAHPADRPRGGHGGTMEICSPIEQGTSLAVEIPLAMA